MAANFDQIWKQAASDASFLSEFDRLQKQLAKGDRVQTSSALINHTIASVNEYIAFSKRLPFYPRASRNDELGCFVGDEELTDQGLSRQARFTDGQGLESLLHFLKNAPRVVNVVALAEMQPPSASSTTSLPLNLRKLSSQIDGAYYAPRKFAALQIAFSSPKVRVLVFHTGRAISCGALGPVAARHSIIKTLHLLKEKCGIELVISNIFIINSVATATIGSDSFSMEQFATKHTDSSHYDRASFQGVTWRAPGEESSIEVYASGKVNLPGSTTRSQIYETFARCLGEVGSPPPCRPRSLLFILLYKKVDSLSSCVFRMIMKRRFFCRPIFARRIELPTSCPRPRNRLALVSGC